MLGTLTANASPEYGWRVASAQAVVSMINGPTGFLIKTVKNVSLNTKMEKKPENGHDGTGPALVQTNQKGSFSLTLYLFSVIEFIEHQNYQLIINPEP